MADKTVALACLFYGFIVFVIGVVSFVLPRKIADLRVRESLWLLGIFGLLHGFRAWLEVVEIYGINTMPDKTVFLLDMIGQYLNVTALLCLGQFTAEIAALVKRGIDWLRWVPLASFAAWVSTTVAPFVAPRFGIMLHKTAMTAMLILGG